MPASLQGIRSSFAGSYSNCALTYIYKGEFIKDAAILLLYYCITSIKRSRWKLVHVHYYTVCNKQKKKQKGKGISDSWKWSKKKQPTLETYDIILQAHVFYAL